jgi:hypothetical protein
MSRTHLRDFFAKCIKSVLNENQMNELYQILEGLPSAALGDLTGMLTIHSLHLFLSIDILSRSLF